VLTTETLGTITLNTGASYISSQSGSGLGAAVTLTIGTLVRNTGTTVGFMASLNTAAVTAQLNTPFDQILITTLGSGVNLVNGILPWATVQTLGTTSNQYDFATFVPVGSSNSV